MKKHQEEQKRKARKQIEDKLLEALDSGEPVEADEDFWKARRQELYRRLERSRRKEKA